MAQAADHPVRMRIAWAAAWATVVALAAWMHTISPVWLGLCAGGALLWTAMACGRRRGTELLLAAALWGGVGLAAGIHFRVAEVSDRWPEARRRIEGRAAEILAAELRAIVERGETATRELARATAGRRSGPADLGLFVQAAQIRRETRVTAVAVYDPEGKPVAWSGEHRGEVPPAVRRGEVPHTFTAGPLFNYLYFTRSIDGGRTAVAAILLEASISVGEGDAPFAAGFRERVGILPRFTSPGRARGDAVWDWTESGVPVLSASFATLTPEAWRARVVNRGRRVLLALGSVLVALLGATWYRRRAGPPGVPVLSVTLALLFFPFGEVPIVAGLFSPLNFVLPVPRDGTLGDLLIVLGGLAVWLLARVEAREASWGGWLLRVAAAALILPAGFALVQAAAAPGLLARQPAGGFTLVAGLALLWAVPLFAMLRRGPAAGSARQENASAAAAMILAAALGIALVAWWSPGREMPVWSPALWAAPFALVSLAAPWDRLGRRSLLPWLLICWVAGSGALAHLWILHLEARLGEAESEIARLGTQPDPFLEFLLEQFSEQVLFHAAEGEEGINLLYRSWVTGGLAAEGYEARVTLWNGSRAASELRLSDVQIPPARVAALLREARGAENPIVRRDTGGGLHYLLLVPLPGERVVSVAVPPRRALGRSTALARFLDPTGRVAAGEEEPTLALLPAVQEQMNRARYADHGWVRTDAGWRSESVARFPEGVMHAHLLVRTPPLPILGARALLAQALLLLAVVALWATGRFLAGDPFSGTRGRLGWVLSFRGRLTLALFGFFLLPLLLLGATVYQALAREVVRTAGALAQRAVEQAAAETDDQTLAAVAEHVDADLLLYRDGVLRAAAAPEVLELGLYPTWLPPGTYLAFRSGEATTEQVERRLGGHEYLIAYRRIEQGGVLASPTPLAAGEIARRRRELADIVGVAVLLGAALSISLALIVGRALAHPIVRLSEAAAAVGAGDLRVRLEEERRDEFGGLFRSFNRMTRRLRHARRALLRETRRTDAILAEASTGILALDPHGRVRLINRRATEVLGVEIAVGSPLPPEGPLAARVGGLVQKFGAAGIAEGGEEIEIDGRTIRLRMRRLAGDPTDGGGTVAALEDISDEVRSARVLAWGEMARQVAHEIKNPLTPIKLSVQHLRRAYADGRPDFQEILNRNVEAVLGEIDRLGEIARAFARFGTPPAAPGELERVNLPRVVEETLALYRGGHDGIDYVVDTDSGVLLAQARSGELKEVLVNLLENARAAMDGDGQIRVRIAWESEYLALEVRDTGEGIPRDVLPRIWDPHFSSRSSGTGLGLAIVRRLVEGWGGTTEAESVPGTGTVIRLRLRPAP